MRQNFNEFLAKLDTFDNAPDIIVLSEIWIYNSEINLYQLPGYQAMFQCRDDQRSGGIAVYIKSHLKTTRLNLTMKTADCVLLEVKCSRFKFKLLAIYRLHEFSKAAFVSELEPIIRDGIGEGNCYLTGDLNLDLNDSHLPCVEDYERYLAAHGFKNLVMEDTRVTTSSSTKIDHMFVRCSQPYPHDLKVIKARITDHSMLLMQIDCHIPKSNIEIEKTFTHIDTLINSVKNTNWDFVLSKVCVNKAFDTFYLFIKEKITEAEKTYYKKVEKVSQPWMTNHLLKKIHKKNKLYKKLEKRPYDLNFREYVQTFRNNLTKEINETKNAFYRNKITSQRKNPKKMWSMINTHIGRAKARPEIELKADSGQLITCNIEKANKLNDYFNSVPVDLNKKIIKPTEPIPGINYNGVFSTEKELKSIYLRPVDDVEIAQYIKKLANGKSPGEDKITSNILKEIYPFVSAPLLHIANLIFTTAVFPTSLKTSLIIPIPKVPNATNPTQFRPVALLSAFSKLYEHLIKTRIMSFYKKTQFFSSNQFGFLPGKSTEGAIVNVMEKVFLSLNDGKKLSVLFLDISKAFDTLEHGRLEQLLENSGIRGNALKLIKSYLSNRKQKVNVHGSTSSEVGMSYGTVQGGVLGPVLFLIYINQLCKGKFKGQVTAYADDLALVYANSTWEENLAEMQEDINYIRIWFTESSLTLNVDKTKFMNLKLKLGIEPSNDLKYHKIECLQKREYTFLECKCPKISKTKEITYLGLTIDECLTWKNHIGKLTQLMKNYVRLFYYLRKMCERDICIQVFHALVHSRLTYGCIAWAGTYNERLKPLITTEKHFVRIIYKVRKTEHSFPLYKKMDLLPLKSFYIFKVLKLYYLRSGNTQTCETENRTRQEIRINIPRPYTEFFKKTFLYIGPQWYNKLPNIITSSAKSTIFDPSCKKFLMAIDPKDL